jgi:hypothetical protein
MRTKVTVSALLAVGLGLAVLAIMVAGCGGGSSSSTGPSSSNFGGGGSSGAVVQGQLVNRQSASGEPTVVVVLRTAFGVGLAEAADVGVEGATVILTRSDGATVTTTTDASGAFTFFNVLPGTYTISVEGKTLVTPVPPITIGAGDVANVTGTVVSADALTLDPVTVTASTTDATIILQNDAQVAHLLNIARAAGLPTANPVLDLRLAGWGWGRIAQHFNVSPSVIGLGHTGVSDADIESFRASHGQGNGKGKAKGKNKGQA